MQTYTHTYIYICNEHMHACIHIYIYAMNICMHAYTHIHTYTYAMELSSVTDENETMSLDENR